MLDINFSILINSRAIKQSFVCDCDWERYVIKNWKMPDYLYSIKNVVIKNVK